MVPPCKRMKKKTMEWITREDVGNKYEWRIDKLHPVSANRNAFQYDDRAKQKKLHLV